MERCRNQTQRIVVGLEWRRWWEVGKMSNPASVEKGSPHWPGMPHGTFSQQNMWKQNGALALMGTQGGRWFLLSFPRLITFNKNTSQLTSGPSMEELCLVWYPEIIVLCRIFMQDCLFPNHYVTSLFTSWEWMWPYMSIRLDKHLNPFSSFSQPPPALMSHCSGCFIIQQIRTIFLSSRNPYWLTLTEIPQIPLHNMKSNLHSVFHVVPSVISSTSQHV